jgi:hypothetical protein
MFVILGLLIAGYGLAGDHTIYQRSLGINVNLLWGVVMLVFGLIMLLLGRHGTRKTNASGATSEE